jgi:fructokinase/N-acetylglucosamine kinase
MSCHVSSNAKIMRDSSTEPPSLRFGIDLGGSKIELIALDAGGEEILRRRIATPHND